MRSQKTARGGKGTHGNDRKRGGGGISKKKSAGSPLPLTQRSKQRAAVTEVDVERAKDVLDSEQRFGRQVFLPRLPRGELAKEALDTILKLPRKEVRTVRSREFEVFDTRSLHDFEKAKAAVETIVRDRLGSYADAKKFNLKAVAGNNGFALDGGLYGSNVELDRERLAGNKFVPWHRDTTHNEKQTIAKVKKYKKNVVKNVTKTNERTCATYVVGILCDDVYITDNPTLVALGSQHEEKDVRENNAQVIRENYVKVPIVGPKHGVFLFDAKCFHSTLSFAYCGEGGNGETLRRSSRGGGHSSAAPETVEKYLVRFGAYRKRSTDDKKVRPVIMATVVGEDLFEYEDLRNSLVGRETTDP